MINAHNVCLTFGAQPIFKNISFTFNTTDRVGLVGRNGSGKSTLLKAIAGMQPLDDGTIAISKQMTLCYLPQEVVLQSTRSIVDETYTAFESIALAQLKKDELEQMLIQKPDDIALLSEYVELCGELLEHDIEGLKAQAR